MGQFIAETIGMRSDNDEIEVPQQADRLTPEMMPLSRDEEPIRRFDLSSVRAAAAAGHVMLGHILPRLEYKNTRTRGGGIITAAYDDSPDTRTPLCFGPGLSSREDTPKM